MIHLHNIIRPVSVHVPIAVFPGPGFHGQMHPPGPHPIPFPMCSPPNIPCPSPHMLNLPTTTEVTTHTTESYTKSNIALAYPVGVPVAMPVPVPVPVPVLSVQPVPAFCVSRALTTKAPIENGIKCPPCPPCLCQPACTPQFFSFCSPCHQKCRCKSKEDAPKPIPPRPIRVNDNYMPIQLPPAPPPILPPPMIMIALPRFKSKEYSISNSYESSETSSYETRHKKRKKKYYKYARKRKSSKRKSYRKGKK